MFSVGDTIIYGSMGVCTVEDIRVPSMPGADRRCYVLRPHYVSGSTVYAPIEGNPVRMRALLSAKEARALVDSLPQIPAFPESKERQELYDTCRAAIKSADSFILAKLLKTLHEKKRRLAAQRKLIPSTEKEYFETAEKMLHGEIATALEMPITEVEGYIAQRLAI